MDVMGELAIIFGVCVAGEAISTLLPVTFPGSVISMIILLALLLSGLVKERHIQKTSDFILGSMGLFLVPSGVGIINYFGVLKSQLLPFILLAGLTTPLIFAATAWSVQLVMSLMRRRKERTDD